MSQATPQTPIITPAPGAMPAPGNGESAGLAAVPRPPARAIDDALQFLGQVLQHAAARRASDIHLRVRNHPLIRVDGVLRQVREFPVLTVSDMVEIARRMMAERHWKHFQHHLQVDLSFGARGVGRVRVNAFYQRGSIAMALRIIQTQVPTPQELHLPEFIIKYIQLERGLVILTGATGCGKSTTIASLINEVNHRYQKHIVTIEDPIEYLFTERRSIVSQREIGVDALKFADAMRAALREDPDVIFLGEMRDIETMETALTAAETGHLVFTTLHAPTAAETVTRMISAFPADAQPTIRAKISQNLQAVIAQRLLPRANGEGRIVACEVMTVTPRVRELILDPVKSKEISDLVKRGAVVEGMLSFDQHLFTLVQKGEITDEVALQHASSVTELKLRLEGFRQ